MKTVTVFVYWSRRRFDLSNWAIINHLSMDRQLTESIGQTISLKSQFSGVRFRRKGVLRPATLFPFPIQMVGRGLGNSFLRSCRTWWRRGGGFTPSHYLGAARWIKFCQFCPLFPARTLVGSSQSNVSSPFGPTYSIFLFYIVISYMYMYVYI